MNETVVTVYEAFCEDLQIITQTAVKSIIEKGLEPFWYDNFTQTFDSTGKNWEEIWCCCKIIEKQIQAFFSILGLNDTYTNVIFQRSNIIVHTAFLLEQYRLIIQDRHRKEFF